ncbi:MAG: PPC domain-containing protein [Kofleriaceae bacterium]|nr:PPC domain-containing protein [Kofleriaceae bacterium]MBP6841272.1 PPC domain-containing protein [Kofleriaceae bacterium]MBP9204914.1 PPC domain-containing protein [Kofleriaceae bacterium]
MRATPLAASRTHRGRTLSLGVLVAAAAPGCSLVLDFSYDAAPPPVDAINQTACDFREPNDDLASASPITTSDTGPAAICTDGDRDFYRFTVPDSSSTVTVAIAFASAGGVGDLDLTLYAAAGSVIVNRQTLGSGETITCPAANLECTTLAMGDYVFEVRGATGTVRNGYTMALTVTPSAMPDASMIDAM